MNVEGQTHKVDGYRHNYEGYYKNSIYQIFINSGRMTTTQHEIKS